MVNAITQRNQNSSVLNFAHHLPKLWSDRFTRVNSRKALCPKAWDTASSPNRYLPLAMFRQRAVRGGCIADYALHILSTLRGLVKYTVDRNNGWSLQYLCLLIKRHQQKPRYSSVYPRQMSGAVLWNSLPIYWPAASEVSWGFEGWLKTILLEIYTLLT